jgi:hypothetical protein
MERIRIGGTTHARVAHDEAVGRLDGWTVVRLPARPSEPRFEASLEAS